MVKIGTGYSIGFAEESPWGTAASSVTHWFDPRGGADSLQGEVDHIVPESLSFRANDSAQWTSGMKRVSGNVTHDLRFGGGWWMFLCHLTGHKFEVTDASPIYTHNLRLGQDLSLTANGAIDPQARGISILVNREGQNAASSTKSWMYSGCRPQSVDFTFAQGSIGTASWDIVGKDVAVSVHGTEALSTAPYISHPSAGGGTLIKSIRFGTDGSETGYNVRAMSLHLEQPVAERRTLEDATQLVPTPGGSFIASGSFEVEALDVGATFDAFTAAHRNLAINSLLLTVEGSVLSGSTNHKLAFDFPKVRVTNVGEATPADSGLITHTVEWEAAYSGTATSGVGIATLITPDAVAYTAAS